MGYLHCKKPMGLSEVTHFKLPSKFLLGLHYSTLRGEHKEVVNVHHHKGFVVLGIQAQVMPRLDIPNQHDVAMQSGYHSSLACFKP